MALVLLFFKSISYPRFGLNNNIFILNTFNNGGAAAYNIVLNIKNGKLVANKAWKVEI